ncbi:hypothetical protein H257_03545 [Aphanomyces astaci]|uniref:Putative auto-transporter adhesin head GIN domain-containing protein n=1 Tax=Aphanomyces astaci TaxID=112090 RepID=W4GZ54_APHAT|nr:hypothetical protein H257_03545 [Aphanomyces astaci]ETV84294.1 hypothetical protein H257_03545 [Aphanomyces astaci]RQM26128.1 hypothetical protein B5M09_003051 [Aphanomyces astaci]|eukprot:XP_009825986.1 hypothetical protein H257_03545 [Aphanomyces astaci]
MQPAFDSWATKTFNATASDLTGLILGKPAFIYEAPAGVQTISAVVKSESQAIVDAMTFTQVTTESGVKALKVDLKQTWSTTFWYWNGDFIVDIYVPKHALQLVNLDGCGDVALFPNTLTTRSLGIELSGSGSVFIQDTSSLTFDHLDLDVSGSGRIQVDVPSIALTELDASLSGSGAIVLSTATIVAPSVETDISGSGDIYILATKGLNVTAQLATSVSGSGRITLADAGTCGTHEAELSGSGSIQAGSMACQMAEAKLSGSGSMYLSSAVSIDVEKSGSGTVAVVGRAPHQVTGAIEVTTSNPVTRVALAAFPAHTASHSFKFGTGLLVILGVVLVVVLFIVIKKVRNRCRRRRDSQHEEPHAAIPYGVATTPVPVVMVEVVPEAQIVNDPKGPEEKFV